MGHGVGLEIHEQPIMRSKSPWKFRKGMVVTVEPGLYYHTGWVAAGSRMWCMSSPVSAN
jgi:Xaa-Pro aminopeptidase